MGQMLVFGNPRKRRKARKARKSRRSRRTMTAKQLLYFGPKRRTRRARRSASLLANPRRRSRRMRRNPISVGALRSGAASVGTVAKRAVTGAAGAVVVDVVAGQVMPLLPPMLGQQYNADGTINFGYHATKAALAVGLGVAGRKFLPGALRGFAAQAAEGSLTVQAYGLMRAYLPATLTLGAYMNPARVVGGGVNGVRGVRGVRGVGRLGAYIRPGMAGMRGAVAHGSAFTGANLMDTRVGEGPVT